VISVGGISVGGISVSNSGRWIGLELGDLVEAIGWRLLDGGYWMEAIGWRLLDGGYWMEAIGWRQKKKHAEQKPPHGELKNNKQATQKQKSEIRNQKHVLEA
jgi:hypothetical protein